MMQCAIYFPDKTMKLQGVQSIKLPSMNGQVQVLPGYAEAFIALHAGNILYRQRKQWKEIVQSGGGVCHIKNDSITIIL